MMLLLMMSIDDDDDDDDDDDEEEEEEEEEEGDLQAFERGELFPLVQAWNRLNIYKKFVQSTESAIAYSSGNRFNQSLALQFDLKQVLNQSVYIQLCLSEHSYHAIQMLLLKVFR